MKIIITKDYEELSKTAARLIASQITLNPRSVLGLATGSTPIGMYKELVDMYNKGEISFEEVISFNLDEYVGLEPINEQSYRYFMNKNLFDHIDIKEENIHIPSGVATDIDEECKNYDYQIEMYNGISMQILGIGRNGHIGFNEPDIKFQGKTHLVDLDEDTIAANARFFENIESVPRKAISLGMKNIMQSRRIVLLASGIEKAETIKNMIFGNIIPMLPASVLQLHPDVTIIVDEEAGKYIKDRL